jgi:hypothetical protein
VKSVRFPLRMPAELAASARAELREHVVEPGYELSFFKTTVGQAPAVEEGVHFDGVPLDTHPDIRSDSDGVELRGRCQTTGVNSMTGMRRFEARSRYCVQPG